MSSPRRGIHRPPLVAERVRRIGAGGFAFFPNRFLLSGFFAALGPDELRLYVLLVLAADRRGMSFYGYPALCSLLQMSPERYVQARNGLVSRDLIAFDGESVQVLELPAQSPCGPKPLRGARQLELEDPATVRCLLEESLRSVGQRASRRNTRGEVQDDDAEEERQRS
jgi:hypothetical protein